MSHDSFARAAQLGYAADVMQGMRRDAEALANQYEILLANERAKVQGLCAKLEASVKRETGLKDQLRQSRHDVALCKMQYASLRAQALAIEKELFRFERPDVLYQRTGRAYPNGLAETALSLVGDEAFDALAASLKMPLPGARYRRSVM